MTEDELSEEGLPVVPADLAESVSSWRDLAQDEQGVRATVTRLAQERGIDPTTLYG